MYNNIHIIGPKSLSEHDHKGMRKRIFIFGDYHEKQPQPCGRQQPQIPIQEFIHSIIEPSIPEGEYLDLFLEIPEKEDGVRPLFDSMKQVMGILRTERADSYLQDTIQHFKQTKHERIRLHYTDLREACLTFPKHISQMNIMCVIRDFLDALSLLVFSPRVQRSEKIKQWTRLKLVQDTLLFLSEKTHSDIRNDLHLFEKYTQIQKYATSSFFRSKLIQARKQTLTRVEKLISSIRRIKNMTDLFNFVVDYYGDFLIEYMDLWTLVQILSHPEYKHIVIYAGHIHAEQYRKDLEKLRFRQVRYDKSSHEISCVKWKE
jgi:hypothetical protein